MKKNIALVLAVGSLLLCFLAFSLYSRFFDYSSGPAHYKLYINQEPSTLHMGASQHMDVTVHKALDQMQHVSWLSVIVHPEKQVSENGKTPESELNSTPEAAYTSLDNLHPSVPLDFKETAQGIASNSTDVKEKARLISKWVKEHVTAETGNIDELVGLVYIDYSDTQRLITFSPKSAEYATVFAGLMRAQNVPTRLIGGHIFANDQFLSQVWNEIWIEGEGWTTVDVINNRIGADNRYIRLYEGATIEKFVEQLAQIKFGVEREDW